jgi:hypothetical protein
MVNAMGPYNLRREPIEEKIARIDDIGGPDTHSNFPLGWAMAANTPLRRYKQNTHGGGIRDPLVMAWTKGIAAKGELRHQFCHASDLAPTLLDIAGVSPPKTINGVEQMPIEGTSFARSFAGPGAVEGKPYFEIFGHRGGSDSWAVCFHPPGNAFDHDKWESPSRPRLQRVDILRARARAAEGDDRGMWRGRGLPGAAARDRFAALRDVPSASAGPRKGFVFHAGMGHLPTWRLGRNRNLRSGRCPHEAYDRGRADRPATTCSRAHHQGQRLCYDADVGGLHHLIVSTARCLTGNRRPACKCSRNTQHRDPADRRRAVGRFETTVGFVAFISWSGLDVSRTAWAVSPRGAVRLHRQAAQGHHDHGRRPKPTPRRRPQQRSANRQMTSRVAFQVDSAALGGSLVGLLHLSGRRFDLSARGGAEGDRGRVRRSPQRALAAHCWASSGRRRGDGLAGRPHVSARAARRLDRSQRLHRQQRRRATLAGYALRLAFGNAGLHAGDEQHPGLFERRRSAAVSIISPGPPSWLRLARVYRWLLPDVGWRQML